MKNEKGVTLIVLVITVIVMIILITVAITYGSNSYSEIKLQNFSYELQQVQGRVDTIYAKMSLADEPDYVFLDGEELGININESKEATNRLKNVKNIDYSSSSVNSDPNLIFKLKVGSVGSVNVEKNYSLYRYFSKEDLSNMLDIKNPKQDVIVNFKTREVISVNRARI